MKPALNLQTDPPSPRATKRNHTEAAPVIAARSAFKQPGPDYQVELTPFEIMQDSENEICATAKRPPKQASLDANGQLGRIIPI